MLAVMSRIARSIGDAFAEIVSLARKNNIFLNRLQKLNARVTCSEMLNARDNRVTCVDVYRTAYTNSFLYRVDIASIRRFIVI